VEIRYKIRVKGEETAGDSPMMNPKPKSESRATCGID